MKVHSSKPAAIALQIEVFRFIRGKLQHKDPGIKEYLNHGHICISTLNATIPIAPGTALALQFLLESLLLFLHVAFELMLNQAPKQGFWVR